MSKYGPPSGPYQGEPQDPWQVADPPDPYSDPWAYSGGYPPTTPDPGGYPQPTPDGPPAGYGPPTGYGPATAHEPQPRPPDVWGRPTPTARRPRSGARLTVLVLLAVVLSGAAGVGLYVATRIERTPGTSGVGTPSEIPSSAANGAIAAKPGDCMINNGSAEAPSLAEVPCGAGTFQVLTRVTATSDVKRCEGVAGYTHNFFFKTGDERTSFVLCMKLL